MKIVLDFFKKEVVLTVSFLLAVISMLFVAPNERYFDYIDFRTLGLLFSLMTIMAGLNKLGIFKLLASSLLNKVKSVRGINIALVMLCFFSSMIITNDVALITFVPFTIIVLNLVGEKKYLIFTVTLETVAANLGSMLTPIGNPQNLYLFSAYNMQIGDFLATIAPYALLSFVMLLVFSIFSANTKITNIADSVDRDFDKKRLIMYIALFAVALLSVFRILNYLVLLMVVIAVVLIFDRKVFLKVDYSLLLTFMFLFIFIGNLGNIESVNNWLHNTVNGNEVVIGIIASQVFSNVPAAILLSGFTDNGYSLLIGVNIGGLGTLIASMASLISFKFIQKEGLSTLKYIGIFTGINVVFLIANVLLNILI